jgi:hypothetical protein
MPKKLRPAVDLMAFKCRTLKVNGQNLRKRLRLGKGAPSNKKGIYGKGIFTLLSRENRETERETGITLNYNMHVANIYNS